MSERPPLGASPVRVDKQLRRGSVGMSAEALRSQFVVPTAIPGETKRTSPLKSNGAGKKNLLNLINKQTKVNREQKELEEAVRGEMTKETIIRKERQDKIVGIFFKESPSQLRQSPPKPKPRIKKVPVDKPKDRGNLSYFLTQSNFKEPKCLSQEKNPKKPSKYDDIDPRLRPATAPALTSNNNASTFSSFFASDFSNSTNSQPDPPPPTITRLITKQRLPPNKKPVVVKAKPETNLLPYPQDVSKGQGSLVFNDVWKKVETKDIFPHAKSFRLHEEETPVSFLHSTKNNQNNNDDGLTDDLRDSSTYEMMNTGLSSYTSPQIPEYRRFTTWTCLPSETNKSVSEMLESGMSFDHARQSEFSPYFSGRFGVKKVDLFDVTPEEEIGLKEEFRSRYKSVVETLRNENTETPLPKKAGDIPPLGKVTHPMELYRTGSEIDEEEKRDHILDEEDECIEKGDSREDDKVPFGGRDELDHKTRANCHSPRNALIRESISRGLIPFRIRELLDVEDIHTVQIVDLKGQGIGDDKMCAVVQSLPYFTSVVELNVSDNRLTDKSIEPLLNMVLFTLANVTIIDLSANKMDQVSVEMLNNYLSSDTCKLRELRLNKSDVDDYECANMMDSMSKNKSIKKLFLSNNFIGVHEELNAVHPDFITGPEAIATMLIQNDFLVELDVSWNSIRGESANTLGQSLATNNHLVVLNLAYNSIGDSGAQQLAHSLRFNASLKYLDVSFNHLGPRTALVFSQVLDSTDVLQSLNMNGNCPGLIGGRALLRSIRVKALAKKTLVINLDKANLNYLDDTFDRQNPSGDYEYDMESPYGYAVVCILFEMASTKPDARFVNVMHGLPIPISGTGAGGKEGKRRGESNDSEDDDDLLGVAPPEMKWSKVNLLRGPSENDRANEMWKQLIEDLVIKQKDIDTAARAKSGKNEARELLSKQLFGAGPLKNMSNMMMQQSKRSKAAEAKKENSKDYFALEKICLNFDLFPEDGPLEDIAAHFSQLPTNMKNDLPKIIKQIFLAAFKVAETYQTSDFRLAVMQAASNREKQKLEKDGNDVLCGVTEITKVLTLLGWKQMTPVKYQFVAEKMVKSLDIFGRGVVCQTDFLRLMMLQFTDSYAQAPGALLDKATGMVWEVPTTGHLQIRFYSTTMPPSKESLVSEETIKIMTGGDFAGSLRVAKEEKDVILHRSATASRFRKHVSDIKKDKAHNKKMIKMATIDEDFAVTAEQADVLLAQQMSENENPLSHAVETILPQVATPMDACRFLASNLSFEQLMVTRDRMEGAFRTVTGIGGGHYLLDFSKKYDRAALKKLSAQSNLEKAKRFGSDVPFLNTSQSANNENFRNACVNGKPRTLTTAWLENMPAAGKIRFDYVNTERMVDGIEPITDFMFARIMDEILFCDDYRERIEKEQLEKDMKSKQLAKKKQLALKKNKEKEEKEKLRQKSGFPAPPLRRAQSASFIDVEKKIGEEEDRLINQRMTVQRPSKQMLKGGSCSFDSFNSATTDDDTSSENSNAIITPQKRLSMIVKRRKQSIQATTPLDSFRFFNAVKGQTSVARRAQLTFQHTAFWNEVQATCLESYMTAYRIFLAKKLQAAKEQILAKRDLLSEGAISESIAEGTDNTDTKDKTVENLQAQNELKFLHQIALYHLTYRLGRIRPYFLADIFTVKKPTETKPPENKPPKPSPKLTYRQRKNLKSKKRTDLETAVEESKKEISVAEKCLEFHDLLRAVEVCLVYQVYFSAKQVSAIVDRLRSKNAPMIVIVNLIQLIFSRIIDLVNFSKIVSLYPNDLKDELFHRIGILNIWTPVYPDGSYRLNLSAWDNREAAKILFKLAEVEPGENLINETFRPSLIEDPIPGWELPMPWTVEGAGAENLLTDPSPYSGDDDFNPLADGCTLDQREGAACRRHGYITFEYTSDPKKGCKACPETRYAMMKERTLGGYRGTFTNDLANLNQPKKRIKQQRAVKIVGAKLLKLASTARAKIAEREEEEGSDDSDDSSEEAVMRRRRKAANMFLNKE